MDVHPEADVPLRQIMDDIDQVAEVAAESVELPHNEGIAGAEGLETIFQTRSIIAFAAGRIAV